MAFLGQLGPIEVAAAGAAMAAAAATAVPVGLQLGRVGRFNQTVLWAGVHGDLATSAGALRLELAEARLPYDGRSFTPHLTLARGRELALPEALRSYKGPVWRSGELVLMASLDGYRPVVRARLGRPEAG
jgi:2'-5' RNA ligase